VILIKLIQNVMIKIGPESNKDSCESDEQSMNNAE